MRALPIVASALLASAASAQFDVAISEVLYNPAGPDAGLERIEIRNNDAQEANLFGYALAVCYPGTLIDNRTYWPFPTGFKIPPGGQVVVHYLEDGLDTNTEFYTGSTGAQFICITPPKNLDNQVGSVAIFTTTDCAQFSSSFNILDFVQWGGTTHHEVQAQVAGIWQIGTSVVVYPEGQSLSYDGSGDTPADWWADGSPTLGLYNEFPGNPYAGPYGSGCAGTSGIPALESTGGPPAMGNQTFRMEITNALPGAAAVVGLSSNFASLPIFSCVMEIDPTTLILQLGPSTIDGQGLGTFKLPVPDDPNLLAAPLFLQGAVVDPGSASGIVAFSNAYQVVL
ncbi:MAG: lamin tail domain-containing protein [Planctomycetota bacterium]